MSGAYYEDATVRILAGDCLDILAELPDASVDAVVTDPPYSLSFMGRAWDSHETPVEFQDWCRQWGAECLRVLKPGGHALSFGGTRTFHRLAAGLEDAGFEIRDSLAWIHAQGFPKSLDVSKAIDKAAGAEREVGALGSTSCPDFPNDCTGHPTAMGSLGGGVMRHSRPTAPATDDARTWAGWGTALKPAFEPIVVARKPLVGTVAANVLAHGTGALNVDGCRVEGSVPGGSGDLSSFRVMEGRSDRQEPTGGGGHDRGRWPANVVLDCEMAEALDAQSGASQSRIGNPRGADSGDGWGMTATGAEYDDAGGASRFFYVAKADASERVRVNGTAHPTVKPLGLMRWLVRLVTPPGGTVLEPFAGSGTTVEACILEGFRCIAIEREADYLPLIVQRVNRRRDPVAAVLGAGLDDAGLFDLLEPPTEATP